jgi:arsenate reductase
MKILFMCVANSARSQLAEALAKKIFAGKVEIESAGSHPKTVNAYAKKVLAEIGIDISSHYSKSIDQLSAKFLADLDYVITLCAEEVCPVLPSRTAKKLHWPFADPAGHSGTEAEQLERFRVTRDLLETKINEFSKEINP